MSAGSRAYALLPPVATEAEVESCTTIMPDDEAKGILYNIATYLLERLADPNVVFGNLDADPSEPSLQTLYARLNSNALPPSLIKEHRKVEKLIKKRLRPRSFQKPLDRPLEDYEDLYYALISRVKDLHYVLTTRLTQFFTDPNQLLFHSFGTTMGAFHDELIVVFTTLNNTSLVATLNTAVKRGRAKATHDWRLAQLEKQEITQEEFDAFMSRIYDPPPYGEINGIEYIGSTSPAMISARLQEKYRILLEIERKMKDKETRWERKRGAMQRVRKKARSKEREARGRSDSETRRRRKSDERKRVSKKKSREMEQRDQVVELEQQEEQKRAEVIDTQRQQFQSVAAAQRYSQEQSLGMQYQGFGTPTTSSGTPTFMSLSSPVETFSTSDWEARMGGVSEYTQYMQMLRGAASNDVKQRVDETHVNARQSLGRPTEPESAQSQNMFPGEATGQIQSPMQMQVVGQMLYHSRQQYMDGAYGPSPAQTQHLRFNHPHANPGHVQDQNQQSFYGSYNPTMAYMQAQMPYGQGQWQWHGMGIGQAQTRYDLFMGGMMIGQEQQGQFGGEFTRSEGSRYLRH